MRLFPLLLLLTGLASCASVEMGRDFAEADFQWIVVGVTTADQVIARHGDPAQVVARPEGGRRFIYQHITSQASAANASMLNPFYTKVDTETLTEMATIDFDENGLVVDWEYTGPNMAVKSDQGEASSARPGK